MTIIGDKCLYDTVNRLSIDDPSLSLSLIHFYKLLIIVVVNCDFMITTIVIADWYYLYRCSSLRVYENVSGMNIEATLSKLIKHYFQ